MPEPTGAITAPGPRERGGRLVHVREYRDVLAMAREPGRLPELLAGIG